jgi:hypothetical protein
MSNRYCNPSESSSQPYIPLKCPTCGLLHTDCLNEKPRGTKSTVPLFSSQSDGSPSEDLGDSSHYPRIYSTLFSYPDTLAGKVWDWLAQNGYIRLAKGLCTCMTRSVIRTDGDHTFVKKLPCRSILCLICGKEDSQAHNTRKLQAYEKLGWSDCLGNVTLTLPKSLKGIVLKSFFNLAGAFVLEQFGVDACLCWFHPIGERLTKNPHIQVLFPLDRAKRWLSRRKIEALSQIWAAWLMEAFPELEIPERVQINYKYEDTLAKIGHAIAYVTRLSFISPEQFIALDDDMKHYLARLRGRRLVRGYGKLSDRNWRTYVKGEKCNSAIAMNELSIYRAFRAKMCPVCGQEFRRAGITQTRLIDFQDLIETTSGWYCNRTVYEEMVKIYLLGERFGIAL